MKKSISIFLAIILVVSVYANSEIISTSHFTMDTPEGFVLTKDGNGIDMYYRTDGISEDVIRFCDLAIDFEFTLQNLVDLWLDLDDVVIYGSDIKQVNGFDVLYVFFSFMGSNVFDYIFLNGINSCEFMYMTSSTSTQSEDVDAIAKTVHLIDIPAEEVILSDIDSKNDITSILSMDCDISGCTYEELLIIMDTLADWIGIVKKAVIDERYSSSMNDVSTSENVPDNIQFRDIPWGSNITEAVSKLSDFDRPSRTSQITISSEIENASEVIIYPRGKAYIAGYELSYIRLRFLYTVKEGSILTDKDSVRLVSAMYYLTTTDKDTAYTDIKKKLSVLYGESVEESIYSGIKSMWLNDDGTFVNVENGIFTVSINYGISGEVYDSWLAEINNTIKLQEQIKAVGNYDGL